MSFLHGQAGPLLGNEEGGHATSRPATKSWWHSWWTLSSPSCQPPEKLAEWEWCHWSRQRSSPGFISSPCLCLTSPFQESVFKWESWITSFFSRWEGMVNLGPHRIELKQTLCSFWERSVLSHFKKWLSSLPERISKVPILPYLPHPKGWCLCIS